MQKINAAWISAYLVIACSRQGSEPNPVPHEQVVVVPPAIPSSGGAPAPEDPGAARSDGAVEEKNQARSCPTRIDLAALGSAPLPITHDPNVFELVQDGKRGVPRRVRLRLHNPLSTCVCPPFAVTDYDPKPGPGAISNMVHAIFPQPLANGHDFAASSSYGSTVYVMTGYFSGRQIDEYEFTKRQHGRVLAEPSTAEEEYQAWKEKYPEFCVESWCVVLDLNPRKSNPTRTGRDVLEYQKYVHKMHVAGVQVCP